MALTDGLDVIRAILSCVQADGRHVSDVILEEKQEAKLKKVTVSDLCPQVLVLAMDEGRKRNQTAACMSPLFSDDGMYDQNRACDAVFLRLTEDGFQVCYIELKSDAPSGYEGQFKSTQCFIKYISALSESLCDTPMKVIRERFVVFHTDSSGVKPLGKKQKTQFKPSSANTPKSPDMHIVRNEDTVRLASFF
jgi:hypothetical protein